MFKFNFNYQDEIKNIDMCLTDEDTTLIQCFATFIEMTRMIGYQSGSWDNILTELNEIGIDKQYTLFDWALNTKYPVL